MFIFLHFLQTEDKVPGILLFCCHTSVPMKETEVNFRYFFLD